MDNSVERSAYLQIKRLTALAFLLVAACTADAGSQAPRDLGALARNAELAVDAGGERQAATLHELRAQAPFEVVGPTHLPHRLALADLHAILPPGAAATDAPHEAALVRMWFRSSDRNAAAVLDQALDLDAAPGAAAALPGEGQPVDLEGVEGRLHRDVYRQCDERGRDCTVLRLAWEACDRAFMLEAVTEPDRAMSRGDLERIAGSIVRRCR